MGIKKADKKQNNRPKETRVKGKSVKTGVPTRFKGTSTSGNKSSKGK